MEAPQYVRVLMMLLVCLLVPLASWWFVFAVLLILLLVFNGFYEGILIGFIADVFYGPPPVVGWMRFPFMLATLALLFLLPYVKRRLVFWSQVK